MTRIWSSLLVGAALALACGTPTLAQQATSGKGRAVAIQLFQFKPSPTEVMAGTRVTWTNQDDITHTVTSGTPESPDARFDSALNGKGTTFSVTFGQPGTYPYFCHRHQSMRGEIRVN
ncbi:MAG: cupredoxin domain-containing protein [Candidatus Rokuibacteriota bacterium]